jgi:hypothetical protein
VPLYAFWHDHTGAYLVLRSIRGGSVQHALRHRPWSLGRATRLLEQLAAALALITCFSPFFPTLALERAPVQVNAMTPGMTNTPLGAHG